MILQNIIFPFDGSTEKESLYYKNDLPVQLIDRYSVHIPAGRVLDLFSYFNLFSASRWTKYTDIRELCIRIHLSGEGSVRLIHATKETTKCVCELSIISEIEKLYEIEVPQLETKGFYYLVFQASDKEGMTMHRAQWTTPYIEKEPVKIAIATCTFRREEYITKNIKKIRLDILNNERSALQNNLEVFVIDNGQSLKKEDICSDGITLVPNANTGGSGGFTRGLIEILHRKDSHCFTHALLMDDDIELETEALERTYALLSCRKKEFSDATIGGAMLRNDVPYILEESGANWTGKLHPMGRGSDLRKPEALFQYDSIGNVDYQAWWFCCIPLSLIGLDNLPLPFFIHDDDIEYGLRNYKQVIQLNGICVWHNTFENKRPSNLEYYDIRNHLILNSIYDKKISLLSQMLGQFKRSTALILRMRYNDVLLNIRGIDDFLKGPKWWASRNIMKLHQEIMDAGYQYLPLPEDVSITTNFVDTSKPVSNTERLRSFLTINGAFLPKKSKPVIVTCGSNPFVLFRVKEAYLWDPSSDKAIAVRFSLKKMLTMYRLLFSAFVRLICGYPKAKKQYQNAYRKIGTEQFWKHHIKLEE